MSTRSIKDRARALQQSTGLPYAEARRRILESDGASTYRSPADLPPHPKDVAGVEAIDDTMWVDVPSDAYVAYAAHARAANEWRAKVDGATIKWTEAHPDTVQVAFSDGTTHTHVCGTNVDTEDTEGTQYTLLTGVLSVALGEDGFCWACHGSGLLYRADDVSTGTVEVCGNCAGCGCASRSLLTEAFWKEGSAAGWVENTPAGMRVSGLSVEAVQDWLHTQTVSLHFEADSNLRVPYPFHVAHGLVLRQDFWKGDPLFLIGFAKQGSVGQIEVFRTDWETGDPDAVIGLVPVLSDADGKWSTWTGHVVAEVVGAGVKSA